MGGHFSINAFGRIEVGDDEKFIDFLKRTSPPSRTTIYIHSTGGAVEPAIAIGRRIREAWFSTSVGRLLLGHDPSFDLLVPRVHQPGSCLSAATLMFLGGKLRYFSSDSNFGVHRFSFKKPKAGSVAKSQMLSAKIAKYVLDMGVSADFLELSSATDSKKINLLTESQLREMRIVTGGETSVIWTVQALEGSIYVRGERDSQYGHHKILLSYFRPGNFVVWSIIEAQGREEELINFSIVEITINNDENLTIDVSDRASRFVNGGYVNILASINNDEAKLIAYSDSFGCRVRGSKEAGVFYGIAPMLTEGGSMQLRALYSMFSEMKGEPA
ncbi:MAG: hypothetical protein EOR43_20985 [Mesorhizobium sp.]|nr:MAG: hypothetical protein EOR43_20985 [Mesorhizobium sp.]RWK29274.1 MAG: hypothetical protein EOR44_20165 [Mesorhizobium sp.]